MQQRIAKWVVVAALALSMVACADLPEQDSVNLKYCSISSFSHCLERTGADCDPC